MSFRPVLAAALAGCTLVVVPSTAAAGQLLSERVGVPGTTARSCLDRAPAGSAGIAQRRVTLPADGIVGARLRAADGDWDLGVFDAATGQPLAASAGFAANEVTSAPAPAGRTLLVQACRRKGDAAVARLSVFGHEVPRGAVAPRLSLALVTVDDRADKARLDAHGFDLTEHAGHDYVEVVLHGDGDRRRLRELGFRYEESVTDLGALEQERVAADRAYARRARLRQAAPGARLPSGRTVYRTLADYEAEMKALVEKYPGLVRPIKLKHKTVEGRDVNGIEIATNVNASDGRPVYLQMGVHHAREWPSGEHAMEWGYELTNAFGKDDRATRLVSAVRTIIVPIINPDGFDVSRGAPFDAIQQRQGQEGFQQIPDPAGGFEAANYLYDPAGAYRRRNCRLAAGAPSAPGVCKLPSSRPLGTDPNRNYGGFWGGPGASALPAYETFRGSGPFSEPETQNVRDLVSTRHVTTLITNHTFSNLILRPPGIKAAGPPPDEGMYRDLGAKMASRNGYKNQPSYELYDTTGGTEDWTYYATGSIGYTFEIGPGEGGAFAAEGGGPPNECYGFHPKFECVIKHYTAGENGGGGNREAYFDAMENAANAANHSLVKGAAPKGVKLRLKKEFFTETSPVRPAELDPPLSGVEPPSPETDKMRFKDTLETTLDIDKTGTFTWSVNPSTRPLVATNPFVPVPPKEGEEPPKPTLVRSQPIKQTRQTQPDPTGAIPGRDSFEDYKFSLPAEEANKTLVVTVTAGEEDDYDIVLFRTTKGADGKDVNKEIDTSGNSPGEPEVITVDAPGAGDFTLRVKNYLASGPWEGKIEIFEPVSLAQQFTTRQGVTEAWTLTCELDGKVLGTQKVVVGRGQAVDVGTPCGADAPKVVAASKKPVARRSCGSSAGFASTKVVPTSRNRRVRFDFARLVPSAVTVDVFQASTGRRLLANRRVATFPNRLKAFSWNGTDRRGRRLTDGVYFVRLRVKGAKVREDFRRHTLVRRNGRWTVPATFYRPDSCGLLSSVKLGHPAFGGTKRKALGIAYRVAATSDVTIRVSRGGKVVKTFRQSGRAGRRTHRLTLSAKGLRKGLYTVRIDVRSGARRAAGTVHARLL